jgi:hypothetical protein
MDHATLRELAAGAALDDLDPTERAELGRHLSTCAPCRRLSTELDDVVGDLALIAPPLQPPTALRASVLAALRDPRGTAGSGGGPALTLVAPTVLGAAPSATEADAGARDRAGRSSGRTWIGRWGGLAAAAVFAIVAVGLGARGVQLADEVAATSTALAEAQAELAARQGAVAVVADPGHVTVALHAEPAAPSADAVVLFVPGTTESYLMANGLPATPDGHVYQLWFADDTGVHALGTFHHDGTGPFVAPFGVDLGPSAAAMVTLEPEGGAVGEPGPQVIFGEF